MVSTRSLSLRFPKFQFQSQFQFSVVSIASLKPPNCVCTSVIYFEKCESEIAFKLAILDNTLAYIHSDLPFSMPSDVCKEKKMKSIQMHLCIT